MANDNSITLFDIWNELQNIKVIMNDQENAFFSMRDPQNSFLKYYYDEAGCRHRVANNLIVDLIHEIELADHDVQEELKHGH